MSGLKTVSQIVAQNGNYSKRRKNKTCGIEPVQVHDSTVRKINTLGQQVREYDGRSKQSETMRNYEKPCPRTCTSTVGEQKYHATKH